MGLNFEMIPCCPVLNFRDDSSGIFRDDSSRFFEMIPPTHFFFCPGNEQNYRPFLAKWHVIFMRRRISSRFGLRTPWGISAVTYIFANFWLRRGGGRRDTWLRKSNPLSLSACALFLLIFLSSFSVINLPSPSIFQVRRRASFNNLKWQRKRNVVMVNLLQGYFDKTGRKWNISCPLIRHFYFDFLSFFSLSPSWSFRLLRDSELSGSAPRGLLLQGNKFLLFLFSPARGDGNVVKEIQYVDSRSFLVMSGIEEDKII